jgi:hypothetical protein
MFGMKKLAYKRWFRLKKNRKRKNKEYNPRMAAVMLYFIQRMDEHGFNCLEF